MTPISTIRRRSLAIAGVCAALALVCDGRTNGPSSLEWEPPRAPAVRGVGVELIRSSIDSLLRGEPIESIDADTWRHVRGLYRGASAQAFWMTSAGVDRGRARQLGDVLVASTDDALDPSRLPLDAAIQALEDVRGRRAPTAGQIARCEVLLTAVYAGLAEQLLTGHVDPRSASQSWHIDPREERVDSALARTLRARRLDRAMDALRPHDDAYDALRVELARYRRLVAAGGWTRGEPQGPPLSPGDTAPARRLLALRERLRAEGLVDDRRRRASEDTAGVMVYDSVLAGAIARFQSLHGIAVDSTVGPETIASLDVPAEYRLAQIAANLERFRWLPQALGTRYILVNVPAFRLDAFDDGVAVLNMKVIVGAEYDGRSTPVFSDSMESVVFRPNWHVPASIAENEIWPRAEADPTFLASHNYEVVDSGEVNGEERPRLRQGPGPGNALGLVKFLFPNSFAIYLHDTPEGELFEKDVRAFSHGCIRVERPAELAQYVLGWSADSVRQLMEGGRDDHHVAVNPKIPVYIVYFTSYVRDGELHFSSDLYSRDEALVDAVRAAAMPDARLVERVKRLRHEASRWRFVWPFGAG
ncbi:MAG TPA: L,D-transpeptidase family protein [Gemmatimonadaceae bacterium]|nr:L,D-transpeptidase family protein [Gemmatimonadaceae bacterium]